MCSKASILHDRNRCRDRLSQRGDSERPALPSRTETTAVANWVRNLPCIAVGVCDGRHNTAECERRRCAFWLAILDLARRSASATLAAAAKAQMPSVSSTGRPAAGGQRDSLNDRLWNVSTRPVGVNSGSKPRQSTALREFHHLDLVSCADPHHEVTCYPARRYSTSASSGNAACAASS
jgi:hypothetical protein